MACDEGQEDHLRLLGEDMEGVIQRLKTDFGDVGDQRIAVMAGIVMADRLFESERTRRGLEAEIVALKESRSMLMEQYQSTEEMLARSVKDLAERINVIAGKLDKTQNVPVSDKSAAE